MFTEAIFGFSEEESENQTAPQVEGQPEPQAQEPEPNQAPDTEGSQTQAPDTGQPQEVSVDVSSEQGQPDSGQQFKSAEDLEKSYQELRSAYNRRDEEISQLRHQNQQLMAYLQQVAYSGYQQGQPQQQQAPAQDSQQQVDPEQWFEELQNKGPAAIQEIVNREIQKQAQDLGSGLQQLLAPLYQHYQMSQLREGIQSQVQQVAQKYPDVAQYADEMEQVAKESPHLLMTPNGAEMIYKAAKLRALESQSQKTNTQVQKRAAQMPSTGASRPGPQPTPEDIVRQQVFGSTGTTQGIFG